ncbi:helix-turn-helix domain-containing protein [Duganella radicis]|uniref:Helix-turn-helix domain-containing protein n=1 Tax=Duganella radicis TaxID=551988 RepID=A0A6L6PC84_9BURK|nr:helix-turn-helix domain-containing protein [Duganella radicis]MTV36025.1 helix-turn-helix domain-containing protein [Duganella radicis]
MSFTEQHYGSATTVPQVGNALNACRKTVHTSSLWQHERVLTGWNQLYDQLSKGKFSGQFTEAWVGEVQLFEEQTSQAVFESGPGRTGVVALGVFANLEGEARWRGNTIGSDHVTALSDHASLELSTPPNCTMMSVSVPVSMLPTGDESGKTDADELVARAANHVHNPALAAMLRERLKAALLTMTYQPYQLAQAEARDQLVSELVGMVDEYLGLALGGSGVTEARKALHVVSKAREYIDANPDRPVTVLDLCNRTYTSRRTLQYCFTQVIGMSPAAYLKVVRLNGLQRDLLSSGGTRTIGDMAARWGFWHLSQLSLDYKRLFGELPSETVKRALQ